MMEITSKIFVAGHRGLVGSAIVRRLERGGFANVLTRSRSELDLTDAVAVEGFFSAERPEYVFLAAAKVGGIQANSRYPVDFLRENLLLQTHVIGAAYRHGARKLMFLGSSCIYPKHAPQPMSEDCLLTGALEPTNEAYAIAKIAGLELCKAYRRQHGFNAVAVMPTNLYGPGDNFNLENAHVLPALLRKCHEARLQKAKSMVVWGSGTPRREFLHVDDLADACLYLMLHYDEEGLINIGWGEDVSIRELAEMITRVVAFEGGLTFDASRPDGTPRKLLDTTRLTNLGWKPRIALEAGLRSTYEWYMRHKDQLRA
jgi:GDP-L-fucose synthase